MLTFLHFCALIAVYMSRVFEADRPGRCPICTREYAAGESVTWTTRTTHQAKHYLPAHSICVEWQHKERDNIRTKDGGWGLRPGRRIR